MPTRVLQRYAEVTSLQNLGYDGKLISKSSVDNGPKPTRVVHADALFDLERG